MMTPARLKEIRLRLGISPKAFAERLGTNRFTYGRWEGGQRQIPETARRLVVLFNMLRQEDRMRTALERIADEP
jgi:DNA-binding transcriptional regulator YiaG